MGRLVLLLFLFTVCFSSALIIFMDSNNCVHLRCQWRGVTDYCKPKHSLREAYKRGRCGIPFEFLNVTETDEELIERVKSAFPVNTFTIDNVELGTKCAKKKKLCCNSAWSAVTIDYDDYLKQIRDPKSINAPNKTCSVQPMPYNI